MLQHSIAAAVLSVFAMPLFGFFPKWHTERGDGDSEIEVRRLPSRYLYAFIMAFVYFSTLFAFISMLWQHVAAATLANTISSTMAGVLGCRVGAGAMALGWIAVGLMALTSLYLTFERNVLKLFERMTDDDD